MWLRKVGNQEIQRLLSYHPARARQSTPPPMDAETADMEQNLAGYYGLYHLIYISRATRTDFADQAECVSRILSVAIEKNARKEVTGALLACDGWFIQLLEGRRIDVGVIFEPIKRDPDHGDVTVITSGPLMERHFPAWSMCASMLSPGDKAIVDVLESSGRFDARKIDPVAALKLLRAVNRLQTTVTPSQR